MRQSAAAALKQKQSYSARQFFFYFKKIPFFSDLSSIAWFRLGKVLPFKNSIFTKQRRRKNPKKRKNYSYSNHLILRVGASKNSLHAQLLFSSKLKLNVSLKITQKMCHSKCLKKCLKNVSFRMFQEMSHSTCNTQNVSLKISLKMSHSKYLKKCLIQNVSKNVSLEHKKVSKNLEKSLIAIKL